jgi:malate dehydrogenase (oxaloacetate-decarboxylating)
VANEIFAHPEKVWEYTALGRTVAIVTNGTAVLGLGNIGVHTGLPVMEGKAVLLDRFAGLSGIPILIPTSDPRTFVDTVTQIAPSFTCTSSP